MSIRRKSEYFSPTINLTEKVRDKMESFLKNVLTLRHRLVNTIDTPGETFKDS